MGFSASVMRKTYQVACNTDRLCTVKIAATLVYKKRHIICTCTNSNKTHPFQTKYAKREKAVFLHAENHCIVTALRQNVISANDLQFCDLYVARAKKTKAGKTAPLVFGDAKPCTGCMRCMVDFNIREVYFTTNLGTVESLGGSLKCQLQTR